MDALYYQSTVIDNIFAGLATNVNLIGSPYPLDVLIGGQRSDKDPQSQGLRAELRSPGYTIIDSIELSFNRNLQPTNFAITLMNPLGAPLALTFVDATISATSTKPGTMSRRVLGVVSSQLVETNLLKPFGENNNVMEMLVIPTTKADPMAASHVNGNDLDGAMETTVIFEANLGIEIGDFKALIKYSTVGLKSRVVSDDTGRANITFVWKGGQSYNDFINSRANKM